MREKFLNEHANCVLIGMKTAHTHTQAVVRAVFVRSPAVKRPDIAQ